MRQLLGVVLDWLKAFLWAFCLLLFVKIFVFDLSTLDSGSMEKSLIQGDVLVINKLAYGPRIPMTVLSIPFSSGKDWMGIPTYLDWITLPFLRLGNGKVENGDILAFNYPLENEVPIDKRTLYIKRCVALPGDIIQIKGKRLLVNDSLIDEAEILRFYQVKSKAEMNRYELEQMGISEGSRMNNALEWTLSMTKSLADSLSTSAVFSSIKEEMEKENVADPYIFPQGAGLKWNKDFFGPLRLPKKGDTIRLNQESITVYKTLLTNYEGNSLEEMDQEVLLNGKVATKYVVKMNYYFVLGDNRDNSADSRYWGFVPENHIIGKVSSILFHSGESGEGASGFHFKRILKSPYAE